MAELIEISPPMAGVRLPLAHQTVVTTIVNTLLGEEPLAEAPVCEATVHLPRRGKVWVATFTGSEGGQVWRSTGLTNREQALLLATRWEAAARAHRLSLGRSIRKPILRVRRQEPGTVRSGPLTQREIALFMNMSERGVREVERRAFQKIRQHPVMRQVWQQYLAGELDERQLLLTPEETEAMFDAAHTPEELGLIQKVLGLIQR